MDIFRRKKKRELASRMDVRFGDSSISAPTQGSWNETPNARLGMTLSDRVSRLKPILRPEDAGSPDFFNDSEYPDFPQHPMVVDVQDRQRNRSRTRTSSGSREHRAANELLSGSDTDGEEQQYNHARGYSESIRDDVSIRSRSQEHRWRMLHEDHRPSSKQSTRHVSPPLSTTEAMRRYRSQSVSTRASSTATPPRQTSMATLRPHGVSQPFNSPFPSEEEHSTTFYKKIPPVPFIPGSRGTASARSTSSSPHSVSRNAGRERDRDQSRGRTSNKQRNAEPIGPQELVPSNDELWGY